VDDSLAVAFDLAAGRAVAGAPSPPAALLAFARRVVGAGRRAFATPPCPAAVFARAQRVPDDLPARGALAALVRLVFDSWAGVAPAARGARGPRFLRFEGPAGSMDVEVVREPGGGARLRGTVDGPRGPLRVVARAGRGRAVRAEVGAGGTFEAALPDVSRGLSLSVLSGRRTVLRAEPVPAARRPRP
jgi:hypothetical protein